MDRIKRPADHSKPRPKPVKLKQGRLNGKSKPCGESERRPQKREWETGIAQKGKEREEDIKQRAKKDTE